MTDTGSAYSRRRTISNAKIFVAGKLFSAGLSIAWLGWLVRLLDLGNYASYVAAMASLEAGIALSSFGVEWLLLRFVPEYVTHGAQRRLGDLIVKALAVRVLGSLFAIAVGAVAVLLWGVPVALADGGLGLCLALLLLTEACMRLLRENALESMGRQGFTQIGIVLRTALLMCGVAWSLHGNETLDVRRLLWVEFAASALTLMYAAGALFHVLRSGRQVAAPNGGDWQPPLFGQAFKMGWSNYLSSLVSFPLSLQALVLMVSSVGGAAQAVAGFGFMVRILEIMRGYLPALLLMNVLRPRFIGLFVRSGSLSAVAREAGLASRLSVLTVAPLIGILAVYGDVLLALASGGKIASGQAVMAALCMTLMVRVHRQITVVLVNCVEQGRLLMVAAGLALLVLPLAWWLAVIGHAEAAALLAVAWDECVWVLVMVLGLRRGGHEWQGDWWFMLRACACALLSAYLVSLLSLDVHHLMSLAAGLTLLVLAYLVLVWLTRTFRLDELKPLLP